MENGLRFVPLRSRETDLWRAVRSIYETAFPKNEQWHEENYDRAFGDPLFEADAVTLDGEVIGLLFHWRVGDWRYIEHLAVDAAQRGRQLGTRILEAFFEQAGGRVILEIDPPEDAVSIRRLHFYERAGFVANPAYRYIHPSYRRSFEPYPLLLLSRPLPLGHDDARCFADFVREHILGRYSEQEGPLLLPNC
ncbi:MAG: GNAT family N-acetyltransferase [Alistipes senegalensis]|nr:GNAT family N-acetyltransferase [Bacteroides cellulosilyticus]MCM1351793.1 GNAT family N-acetyltransferase [Alistipes senegalensis]